MDLQDVVGILAEYYRPPAVPSDPFELILWGNIGYLVDDERRRALFDEFAAAIGLDPIAILAASDEALLAIARKGGMRPGERVRRWREIAAIVVEACGGDLRGTLEALPLPRARALLRRFPAIGDPGADRILLLSGLAPRPALESNGVRTLARLGFSRELATWPAAYRDATQALGARGLADAAWLARASLLLREHGKALCRRGEPICIACPLEAGCPKAPVKRL